MITYTPRDGFNEFHEIKSLKDLTGSLSVKNWTKDQQLTGNSPISKFHQLSYSTANKAEQAYLLMAEYDKGETHLVIGHIVGEIETLGLPKWTKENF